MHQSMFHLRTLIVLGLFIVASPVLAASLELQRGEAALKASDYAAAIALFKSATATESDQPAALMGWGDALAGAGDRDGAVQRYKKALA
ncbi:MAG: hypothetical protein JKY20_06975, partial [Alphaproteobacteria bacterium]|nr:hypothetical protein [Alphaproteobacteria bacterium]